MQSLQAVAIFCEDIRSEASGQDTIVGTFPDNLNLPPLPMAAKATPVLPKLGLYLRMNLDVRQRPSTVEAKLLNTDGSVIGGSSWTRDVIDKAFSDAQANSLPLVGMILKVIVGPLPIPKSGKLTAVAVIDGSECLVGALNLVFQDANASALPAS